MIRGIDIDPSYSNLRLSFNKIKMGFVLIGSLIFISMAFIDGCNAAQATCEFGPMPGVEGNTLYLYNILLFSIKTHTSAYFAYNLNRMK